jgi:hypothetical protein
MTLTNEVAPQGEFLPPAIPMKLARPLPVWAWVFASLIFPMGLCIAFGAARLWSWKRSIAWAIAAYGLMMAVMGGAEFVDHSGLKSPLLKLLPGLSFALYWLGWGFCLFMVGKRKNYWTPQARRIWSYFAWVGIGFLCLTIFAMEGTIARPFIVKLIVTLKTQGLL